MSKVDIKELMDAGVHFGHRTPNGMLKKLAYKKFFEIKASHGQSFVAS